MNPFLFVWIALLLGVFWFMILRPRREAARRSLEVSRALDVGEEVITIGGLYGTIVSIDDREVELEVSDGVTLRFARRAIAGKAPVDEPADEELDEDEDEEDVIDAELEDDELEDDDLEDDGVLGEHEHPAGTIEQDDASDENPIIERARNADESTGR
jgi:preprotein translocase subunit YajC